MMNLKATSIIRRDSSSVRNKECQSTSHHCDLDVLDILIDTTSKLSLKERSNTAETEEMFSPSSFERPRVNLEKLTIDIVTSSDDEFIWYADTPSSCGTREGDYNARELLFFPDGSSDSNESNNHTYDPVVAGVLIKLSQTEAA